MLELTYNYKKMIHYSKDWKRKGVFAIGTAPHFDILVDKKEIYFIEMPKGIISFIGFLIGFFTLQILGAIIGTVIGLASDKKRRENLRKKWLNENNQIFSSTYEEHAALKIPLKDSGEIISFKPNKILIKRKGGGETILQKNESETEALKQLVMSHSQSQSS